MEAQRYPADYDGIIAGAPVNARVHQMIWELWVAQAVHKDEASYIPPAKYKMMNDAVARKVRCRRWREGRPAHVTGSLPLRSGDAAVQGWR